MVGWKLFAAFAGLVAAAPAAHAAPEIVADPRSADSTILANALSGQALQLTMRGTTVAVMASAVPAEGGCSALISAHAPGQARKWNRLFRWSELAWTGTTADGGTKVAFFEHEGRLPGDTVVFNPADGAGVRATLARLANSCRAARGEVERVIIPVNGGAPSCYFARLPGLQLLDASEGQPARAVFTVLSRETPEAELQLVFERAAGRAATGDAWGNPSLAFTFADARVKDMGIAGAAFAIDRTPVAAQHAVAAYGDTRVRISIDPSKVQVAGNGAGSFYRRLAASGEVALTLLDRDKQSRAVLHFDLGPMLATARTALSAAAWSCAEALPAPPPAAHWQPRD